MTHADHPPASAGAGDSITVAWLTLAPRAQLVLEMRFAGATLEETGRALGVTRERARQLQRDAESQILAVVARLRPGVNEEINDRLGDLCAVSERELADLLDTPDAARDVLLRALGAEPPRTWCGDLRGWWTLLPAALIERLRALADQAPFADFELADRANALGLSVELPLVDLLGAKRSPLVHQMALGWLRRTAKGRDAAYLWLTAQAEPRRAEEIADAVAWPSKRALREAIRRDERFVQLRPEGSWALRDWKIPASARQYSSAVDVVVEVLRERGALPADQLMAEAKRRYPVSTWRYTQTLSSNRLGRTPEGFYDLAERGAIPVEDTEPHRPANMVESGRIVAVKLAVDNDVLRGSGIGVNRWLPWRLGLRNSPSERSFELLDPPGEVIVRRNTSTSSVSSLRALVTALRLVEGCVVALVLRLENDTADVRHGCAPGSCPLSTPEAGSKANGA
jgi:Sigma-70, region 4